VILPRSGPGYYNTEFPGQMWPLVQ
jgi:hypothetical protein